MILAPALLACLPFLISPAAASPRLAAQESKTPDAPKQEPAKLAESYRVRIANTLYGPVEVSADEGKTWTLIGRVQKAAANPGEGGASATPAVERVSRDGIAFSIGGRRLVRILPDLPANYKNGSGIVVSMARQSGLFNELPPPVGATVQMW